MLTTIVQIGSAQRGWLADRVQCSDGFSISVQANQYTYCLPRDDDGPYTEVECGFPSAHPGEEMMEYAETPSDPTGTVYAYVPVDVVKRLIEAHGGEKV